jgi:hypothetical protein
MVKINRKNPKLGALLMCLEGPNPVGVEYWMVT